MTPNLLFSIANALALAAWLLLIVLPRQQRVSSFVARPADARRVCRDLHRDLAATWKGSAGGFSSLPDVATLFSQPWLLLAGWIHYLAFISSSAVGKCARARTKHPASHGRAVSGADLHVRAGRMAGVSGLRAAYPSPRDAAVP